MVAQYPGEAPASPWKGRPVTAVPGSGYPMENVRLEPDPDYADDQDLVFERGGCQFRTRLTPADRAELLRALLAGAPLSLYHWRFPGGEEFGLYGSREQADARCAGKQGAEVLSLPVADEARRRNAEYERYAYGDPGMQL